MTRVVSVFAPVCDEVEDLVRGVDELVVRRDGQPPGREFLVHLRLTRDVESLHGPQAVHDHRQRPGCGDRGILLTQRPGSSIAWVGERVAPLLHQGGVETLEVGHGKEHLAAHLEQIGHIHTAKSRGDGLDGSYIGGDVLPDPAVATSGTAHQTSSSVHQIDGEPIDLEFAEKSHRCVGSFGGARQPGRHLVAIEDVVQTEQPLQVLHRGELGDPLRCPDPLSG